VGQVDIWIDGAEVRIIKATNSRDVLFLRRRADPLLIDRIAEYNRRQIAERRIRRRAQAIWAILWVGCAVVAVYIGWWMAR
jgi:hypothetical protein